MTDREFSDRCNEVNKAIRNLTKEINRLLEKSGVEESTDRFDVVEYLHELQYGGYSFEGFKKYFGIDLEVEVD